MNSDNLASRLEQLISNADVKSVLDLDKELDELFYADLDSIENTLKGSQEADYANLDPRALLTSYVDYYQILKRIPENEELIDLGSGYSRGSFLSSYLKLASCISLEYQKDRVKFSKERFEIFFKTQAPISLSDLGKDAIPDGQNYFLYFPRGTVLDRILSLIYKMKNGANLFVIESHGDMIPYLMELKFLELKDKMDCSLPRHDSFIYQFQFNNIENQFSFGKDIYTWLIQNYDLKASFKIKLNNYQGKDSIDWYIPVQLAFIEEYRGRPHLNFRGRLVDIHLSEQLSGISFEKFDEINELYQNLRNKKVFLEQSRLIIESI